MRFSASGWIEMLKIDIFNCESDQFIYFDEFYEYCVYISDIDYDVVGVILSDIWGLKVGLQRAKKLREGHIAI